MYLRSETACTAMRGVMVQPELCWSSTGWMNVHAWIMLDNDEQEVVAMVDCQNDCLASETICH